MLRSWSGLVFLVLVLTACENASPTAPGMVGGQQPEAGAGRTPAKTASPSAKDLPACQDRPYFDATPIALDEFRALRPLGFLAPPGQVLPARHSAFTHAKSGEAGAAIKFPGKGWVTSVVEQTLPADQHGFSVTMCPCRDLKLVFGHVGAVSPKLAAEMAKVTPSCQDVGGVYRCDYDLKVEVASGEALGQSGDGAVVDVGLFDYRIKPAAFVEPAHYSRDWLHAAPPVPYFAPAVRTSLEAKLASDDGRTPRSAEPRAGAYVQDLPGTAQGNWFPPGRNLSNTGDTASFLALVHDHVDPSQPLLSVGSSIAGLPAGLYTFTPGGAGSVNRDFADVNPEGGVYCFDGFAPGASAGGLALLDPGGPVLLAMPGPRALRIEKAGGTAKRCADLGPLKLSDAAAAFER